LAASTACWSVSTWLCKSLRRRVASSICRSRSAYFACAAVIWPSTTPSWSFSPCSLASTDWRSRVLAPASSCAPETASFADLLGQFSELILRRGARRDRFGQRRLGVLRLLVEIGGGAGGLLQVLQVGGQALARELGALQPVVHLRTQICGLRPEIGDQQPTDDRQRGEGEGNRAAEIIAHVSGHSGSAGPRGVRKLGAARECVILEPPPRRAKRQNWSCDAADVAALRQTG
jgi:hypothetical protein